MKKHVTWIIVADGGRARLLANDGPGKGVYPVSEKELVLENPPTRAQGTDRPGRTGDRMGPARHAMEPRADWHQFEKTRFAREISRLLDNGAQEGRFERLVLIAPPRALGSLRAHLDPRTRGLVVGEINKDLTHCSDTEITDQLGVVLAA
ncbi:MAG: host attachment protein [Alphaproteobacteria bacterium]|nr:host attachment protein [Alphaproteobacteria bacterium]